MDGVQGVPQVLAARWPTRADGVKVGRHAGLDAGTSVSRPRLEGGETDWLDSVTREVRNVRSSVGVCDVSTLGKIDVPGTDAVEFLERIYCNTWKTLLRRAGLSWKPDERSATR